MRNIQEVIVDGGNEYQEVEQYEGHTSRRRVGIYINTHNADEQQEMMTGSDGDDYEDWRVH